MRKICISLLLILYIVLITLNSNATGSSDESKLVNDEAYIISSKKASELETKLKAIKEKYRFSVVIVTVNSTGYSTAEVFADDYFDYNDYGTDGILFLINMGTREWHMSTSGRGITYFTDYGLERMDEIIVPFLRDGKYDEAMQKFADVAEEFIIQGRAGEPYDTNNKYLEKGNYFIIILVILLISASVSGAIVRSNGI